MNRQHVQDRLKYFICKELLKDPSYPLAADEPLMSGGLISSYLLVQVALFIEEAFGVHIPDADLTVANLDTLAQMTDRVMREFNS